MHLAIALPFPSPGLPVVRRIWAQVWAQGLAKYPLFAQPTWARDTHRMEKDLDIFIDRTAANVSRLAGALRAFGFDDLAE